jgi:hypothetical protein
LRQRGAVAVRDIGSSRCVMTDTEHELWREMRDCLLHYEQERYHSYKIGIKRPKPEINVLAFKVAIEVDLKHTFGRILLELVKYGDEIRLDVRRYLIKRLREQAAIVGNSRPRWGSLERGFRNARERNAKAQRCAQLWNSIADQFEQLRDVTPPAPPKLEMFARAQRVEGWDFLGNEVVPSTNEPKKEDVK